MKTHSCALVLALGTWLIVPGAAFAKLKIAASTNDLASIAASVGGDAVEVISIARPNGDVHRVEVLPSSMVKVARARLYLKVGLGLDQWADGIIDGSRNTQLVVVDCSAGVNVLEKPTGKVDASMGDVHPNGNPHYWLDPRNGAVVAGNVAEALARVDPGNAERYRSRAATYAEECSAAWKRVRDVLAALPAKDVLTYHRSWTYFADAFGLQVVGTVEPVPGIPPTARHLADLVAIVKSRHVRVLIQEPYFSSDAGKFLSREGGIAVVTAAPSCDAVTPDSYLRHFDDLAGALRAARTVSP